MIKQLVDLKPQRARRNTEKIKSSSSVELCVLRGLKNNASSVLALGLTFPKAEQSANDQAIS